MSNEELDSQLSAMFDDELPAPECELLARRLARDEQLRGRWGHYAAIGACIRGERGIQYETALAGKVNAAIRQEAAPSGASALARRRSGVGPWLTSLGGVASAAAVAAVAILWMRSTGPDVPNVPNVVAQTGAASSPAVQVSSLQSTPLQAASPRAIPASALADTVVARPRVSREPDSYVVPTLTPQGPELVPPTELANYIVAHSEYSGPLMQRNALSALVGGDSAQPQVTAQPIAATVVIGK